MIMRHKTNAKLRRIILPGNYFTRDSKYSASCREGSLLSSNIIVGEVHQALIEQHLLIKLILRSIVRGVNFLGTAGWGEVNEAIKVGAMWAEP